MRIPIWSPDDHGDCLATQTSAGEPASAAACRSKTLKFSHFRHPPLRRYALCRITRLASQLSNFKEITMRYFVAAAVLLVGCTENKAPSTSGTSTTGTSTTVMANKPVDRDNTAVNVRDRNQEAKTPIDQNENKADVKTTADIRKAVVDSKMSTDAHNVKIITQDGKVTLRGPVKSDDEKRQIEEIAVRVAGDGNVISEIDVEAKK
jgi:hypothetical protein